MWWRPPGWLSPRWLFLACFSRWWTSWYSSALVMFSRNSASEEDQRSMAMQWYIIHTYSGFEKKVKESLESRVAAFNLQDKIGRVLIPMEEVMEVRGGKKVVSSRMSYPGYVLVEMDLDENTWHIVRATPRVTEFVGSATSPSPLSDAEVDAIINPVPVPTDRPQPLEGFRDDFWAFDAGGVGFCECREVGIAAGGVPWGCSKARSLFGTLRSRRRWKSWNCWSTRVRAIAGFCEGDWKRWVLGLPEKCSFARSMAGLSSVMLLRCLFAQTVTSEATLLSWPSQGIRKCWGRTPWNH